MLLRPSKQNAAKLGGLETLRPPFFSVIMAMGRWVLAALFVGAGLMHFVATRNYVRIVPDYLSHPFALVYVSGVFEVLGGVGLLVPQARRFAAWGLIALLIAVLPANVQMALDHATKWRSIPAWALWGRVPLQLPLMVWVWLYTRRG